MIAIDLLKKGRAMIFTTHGQSITIHLTTPVITKAVAEPFERVDADTGHYVHGWALSVLRSALPSIPPAGIDITFQGTRWRYAGMRPGQYPETVDLLIEGEAR